MMSPDAWQTCPDPETLLEQVAARRLLTPRKARLFGCACVRQLWDAAEGRSRKAVEVAERFIEGEASERELADAYRDAEAVADSVRRLTSAGQHMSYAAAEAANPTLPDLRGSDDCLDWGFGQLGAGEEWKQADLVRCLFPPPPDHRVIIPQGVLVWNHRTAINLALRAYNDRDFTTALLSVLADALEEAGCTDAWALSHLRGGGLHARGCAVVDAVLGKS
jgi:hypothetical protein